MKRRQGDSFPPVALRRSIPRVEVDVPLEAVSKPVLNALWKPEA